MNNAFVDTPFGPAPIQNRLSLFGGSQKGGFQKGGFGGCSPGTKTGTRVHSPKPPFWKPPFYLPMTLFGVDKRVVSKRVVSADVPPERKPERGYVRQNHPFTKPPFCLPVIFEVESRCRWVLTQVLVRPSRAAQTSAPLVDTRARPYKSEFVLKGWNWPMSYKMPT